MSDLHQSRRCNFLFKGNLKEEESGISFLFSSLRGSRFKSNPAPSDGGGGGRDDSAGTRETTRLTDSHSNINRNMAAPEGESSAEERKSSSTTPPKKNFTAANQNVFLFNSSSLVASFSLPVALCTQNSAYWLGLFEARSPTHTLTQKKMEKRRFSRVTTGLNVVLQKRRAWEDYMAQWALYCAGSGYSRYPPNPSQETDTVLLGIMLPPSN